MYGTRSIVPVSWVQGSLDTMPGQSRIFETRLPPHQGSEAAAEFQLQDQPGEAETQTKRSCSPLVSETRICQC